MQASVPPPSRRATFGHLALILATGCALAACDKHSAAEVPVSYGHGSARQKSYSNHQADSSGKRHYSDTQGAELEKHEEKPAVQPATTPAGTPGGHFFK